MKTLGIVLLLTLTLLLLHTSASPIAPGLLLKGGCCPRFRQMDIRKNLVMHVAMSPDYCKVKALMVVTVANRTLCIDPSTAWSKKRLEESKKPKLSNNTVI